jgi:sporulation protein YunB
LIEKRKRVKKHKFVKIFLTLILIFSIAGFFLDLSIRPLIKAFTAKQAEMISTTILNETISKELIDGAVNYSDLARIERNKEGKILAIDINTQRANLLKSRITAAVQKELADTDSRKITVPLGSLTGTYIFDSRGPEIPLRLSMCGNISANFSSSFVDAGINQTRHQIFLEVSTEILALVPGYPSSTGVKTNMLIVETVIVGEIPQIFANFGDSGDMFKIQNKSSN